MPTLLDVQKKLATLSPEAIAKIDALIDAEIEKLDDEVEETLTVTQLSMCKALGLPPRKMVAHLKQQKAELDAHFGGKK